MAKEPDQTRWVGIRPTDPSEDIPVTESAPLTDILVSPLAAGTEFKTLTEKRGPAIGDMQAIKGFLLLEDIFAVVAAGPVARILYTVPIETIGITTVFSLVCTTNNPTTVLPFIQRGASNYYLGTITYTVAWQVYCVQIQASAYVGDKFGVMWNGCLVGDNLWSTMIGYTIPLYS